MSTPTSKPAEEAGKKPNIPLIASIVIIIVLAGLLAYTYHEYSSELQSKQEEITLLQSELQDKEKEITSLKEKITLLQEEIASLNERITSLSDIVNLKVKSNLERDKTVNIPAGEEIVLSYNTPYGGYLLVRYTATGGVCMWFENTFVGGYYYRYPVPTSGFSYASSGSFVVPVLPGTTTIHIVNPDLLLGATVTLTIEYYY